MKKFITLAILALACNQDKMQKSGAEQAKAAPTAMAPQAQALQPSSGRDYVSIVGSSTVYPFSTVVAEQFSKTTKFKAPTVESTGSGGGLKLFCEGVGIKHPDIANSSRRIKASEVEQCAKNGVKDIVELKIGYDGIVLANSKQAKPLEISLRELWLALAKEIPDPKAEGKLVANPYATWKSVSAALPATKIEVLGPPPTSGTRDAFVELAMEAGCSTFAWIKELKTSDEKKYKAICHTIREDGAFVEAGENDNLIVQKLEANSASFGIFGFSFLEQNAEKVQGAKIDGVLPEFESIAASKYPISRPLFVYVKKGHVDVIPGIKEFLSEFTSPKAWGNEGYLAEKGMIPMPAAEQAKYAEAAKNLTPLTL